MNNSSAFDIINNNVENNNLRKIIHSQYIEDNWADRISELNEITNTQTLSHYDQIVRYTFLGRGLSLKYSYKDSLEAYEKGISLISNNIVDEHEKILKAFILHNYAISLGYMGRKNDERFKGYISGATEIYQSQKMDNDLIELKVQLLDVELYYLDEIDMHEYIRNCNELYEECKNKNLDDNGLPLRIAVASLFKFIKSKRQYHYDISLESFNAIIDRGDNTYRSYWAKCGLTVLRSINKEDIDLKLLDNSPGGYLAKAKRFPHILFIIIRVNRLLEKENRVNKLLLETEKRITRLLSEFEDDQNYKTFILKNFGLIIEEWLDITFHQNISNEEKFYYMVHCSEILQNRLMNNNSFLKNVDPSDHLFNAKELIKRLYENDAFNNLLYITIEVPSINGDIIHYFCSIQNYDDRVYRISRINKEDLKELKQQFPMVFRSNNKYEQDRFLDDYGKLFYKHFTNDKNSSWLVIPNGFFSYLPVHMGRYDNKYFYQISNFNYIPSINIDSSNAINDGSISVFYHSEELMGVKEAKSIEGKFDNVSSYPDPKLKEIEMHSKSSSIIHFVTHHREGIVYFKDSAIDFDDIIEKLNDKMFLVVMNVCSSTDIIDYEDYPVLQSSLAHKLLEIGVKYVITHNWQLGQKASYIFSDKFYDLMIERNEITFPEKLNEKIPSMYGGYMIWGCI